MKHEISAGAVIIHKRYGSWNVLLLRDMNNNLTFPKGLIEKGEEHAEAAMREAAEETGVKHLLYAATLTPIRYFYVRDNTKIFKTVYYLVFTLKKPTNSFTPQTEEGISDIAWYPLTRAIDEIGYPKTNRNVLLELQSYLKEHHL